MLWGSRFSKKIDGAAMRFSSSLATDIRLIKHDIDVSKAQAGMLAKQGIITAAEADEIIAGLRSIFKDWRERKWIPDPGEYEDIHSAVEIELTKRIGSVAGKLHTGRSRNDQVATGFRLWVKEACNELLISLGEVKSVLLEIAENNVNTIIPGYTHMQRAQPVSLAFHLMAYHEMFERDEKRICFVKTETDYSPLGCGALAGSTLPLDREYTARKLGFDGITANALDTVSDRDFAIDFLNACAVGMMHLSRFCEEIIFWSSSEWNFIKLSDEYTTGSSLMPQKKNPDIAELIRGKSGRVYGNYISLMAAMKGLPLSYNRDMQEDKEPVFDSYDTYNNSLSLLTGMLEAAEFNKKRFLEELDGDFCLATVLAEWLVKKGVPFREAHGITGTVICYCEKENKKLNEVSLEEFANVSSYFDCSVLDIFDIQNQLGNKKTYGSPNPAMVVEKIMAVKRTFEI